MKQLLGAIFILILLMAGGVNGAEKEWTYMVFLNGDNNLDSYGTKDVNEMKLIGSNDQLNIIVQQDGAKQGDTRRLFVKKNAIDTLENMGEVDMGDWHNLVAFAKWGIQNYPAKKYVIVIWNHGAGWEKSLIKDPLFKGISYDDQSGNHITTPQLGQAFAEIKTFNKGKNIDVVGHDACLMGMLEVGYEMKDSVDIFVGSQETEPGDGWPYDQILAKLAAKPTMDSREFATIMVDEYGKSYNGGSQGTQNATQSAMDLSAVDEFIPIFNEYTNYLIEKVSVYKDKYISTFDKTQKFYYSQYKDFYDFASKLKNTVGNQDPILIEKTNAVLSAFNKFVVANATNGSSMANAKGMSLYMPTKAQLDSKKSAYSELILSRDASWAEFLSGLYYPNYPIISIVNFIPVDSNGDNFITSGEALTFKATFKNDGSKPALNVEAKLSVTEGQNLVEITNPSFVIPKIDSMQSIEIALPLSLKIKQNMSSGSIITPRLSVKLGNNILTSDVSFKIDPNYVVKNKAISSDHDYANGMSKSWTISEPGAKVMRVHFTKFATEMKYDLVKILDKDNKVIATYDGDKGAFWSDVVLGDTITIQMTSDSSVVKYGFDIDKYGFSIE